LLHPGCLGLLKDPSNLSSSQSKFQINKKSFIKV